MNTSTLTDNINLIEYGARGEFADTVREFLAEADVPADVSLTVSLYTGFAIAEVTKWDTDRCANCEQLLRHSDLPGAMTSYDQFGEFDGSYVARHGCGAHYDPASVTVRVSADDDLGSALAGVLAELEGDVQAHLGKLRVEWIGQGKRALEAVQAELDSITDDEERAEFLASHEEPSGELINVVWDGTKFYAEVYAPSLSETAEPELVYA
ncbi:hypothetical protein [Mycobacteroides abscessus]|uniref:hypothetical protein n=1 Tax=Mycobacteroides abscessus TaxID=36809 RepID=UPI00092986C7|nr:hypothetical protein [Mycobacteroides abscessus]SIF34905.1 Uncharacterised protein [Mycobacteroides abscessus subsp. abscessus]